MKIQTKVFLPGDTVRALDEAAKRLRRSKSEIVRAAVASFLSPDGAEVGEASITRRLDRMSRQIERLERDVTISNEAVALYIKTWMRQLPVSVSQDDQAAADLGRQRYARFVSSLARRLALGKLLRDEVLHEGAAEAE